MIEVRETLEFADWFARLRDGIARNAIIKRIGRVELGPGYRLYFTRRGSAVVILLCGGDKRGQSRDIDRAKASAAELE